MKTMKIEKVKEKYFRWMVDIVGNLDDFHINLLWILHSIPFEMPKKVDMDVNRIIDAMDMRVDFLTEMNGQQVYVPVNNLGVFSGMGVSVFEALVALARKCENDIMYDNEKGDRTSKWFWLMMENLDLVKYNDIMIKDYTQCSEDIHKIINKFMRREYDEHGNGGLWPNEKSSLDQRTIDIWSQMTNYLSERGEV